MGVVYLNDSAVLVASAKKSSISIDRIQAWTGNHYYNLYQSAIDKKGNLLKLKSLKNDANSKFNDGPACYDSINGVVYFTRNSFLDGTKTTDEAGVTKLKIYKGDFDGEGLKNIQELSINSDQYSCGYPSISGDGKTLYFSCDKPGGFGGADIYKVSVNSNGILGTPVNLGEKVNTEYDEIFPFIHPRENILFFSSHGHKGLGGQDVFIAKISSSDEVKSVENVGVPINSSMDDLAFVNNASQTKGYVVSNRTGGEGSDDIYSFKQFSPYRSSPIVEGLTKDLLTDEILDSVNVQLVDKNGKVVNEMLSDKDGHYEFYLESIKDDFKLVAKKEGYVVTESLVTYNEDFESYEEDILLMPIIDYYLAGKVKDKNTLELLEDVTVSITDLKSNDSLPTFYTDGNGDFRSEIVDYVYGDTIKYELVFSKKGYISKTYVIRDFLSTSSEIYITGKLDISLTPIEEGVEVGEEIGLAAIYFDLNSSELRPESKVELAKIADFLNENPDVSLELGAHTDCRADDEYNVWLSKRRAKSSAKYIKSRISNPKRITYEGYGETKPVADCNCEECSDDQHQLNRRTEFVIVEAAKKEKI
jgi:flagellar motor protein MotB